MLIDTHAHLNFVAFKDDADEVIKRCLDSDVWLINAGAQYTSSKRAVDIAKRYEKGVYAAVGLHPIHAQDEFDYEKYKQLALSERGERRVVAIGEIGLDYKQEYVSFNRAKRRVEDESKDSSPKEKQKEVFLQQLELAKELKLAVIFHCRMAHSDLIKILAENSSPLAGVIHCFTGTWQEAEQYLAMGLHLGFNGIIFKYDVDEVIKKTPLDKILVETDCPYLTPPPKEGRNEPIYVKYVAERIAKIKNTSYEEIADITTQNAKKLFKI